MASATQGLTPADRAWVAMAADMAVRLLRSELRNFDDGETLLLPAAVPDDAGLTFFANTYLSIFLYNKTVPRPSLRRVLVPARDCLVFETVAITGYRSRDAFMEKLSEMLGANGLWTEIQAELLHTYARLFGDIPGSFASLTRYYNRRRSRRERGAQATTSSSTPFSADPVYVRMRCGSAPGSQMYW